MTKLERRDRRRARKVLGDALKASAGITVHWGDLVPIIAAALKREREDAAFAAVNYLFAREADRAKATAAILGPEKGER